jgi:hypothetical protein
MKVGSTEAAEKDNIDPSRRVPNEKFDWSTALTATNDISAASKPPDALNDASRKRMVGGARRVTADGKASIPEGSFNAAGGEFTA